MSPLVFKIIFAIGVGICVLIRVPFQRQQLQNTIVDDRKTPWEMALLALISLGMLILPFLYILSPWLNFANYPLPVWLNGLGVVVFALAIWLFWRAHSDLGKNWSPTLQIREGHTLITNGIYQHIRHPMYSAILLWCLAQTLLLPNWLAGWSGMVCFGIAYLTRVEQEEQMLLEQFGVEYETYKQQTKRLIPYLF